MPHRNHSTDRADACAVAPLTRLRSLRPAALWAWTVFVALAPGGGLAQDRPPNPSHRAEARPTIALLDFDSTTLDQDFLAAFSQAVWSEVRSDPSVRILDRGESRRYLISRDLYPDLPYGPKIPLSAAAGALGADYLVTGHINQAGDSLSLDYKLFSAHTQDTILVDHLLKAGSKDRLLLEARTVMQSILRKIEATEPDRVGGGAEPDRTQRSQESRAAPAGNVEARPPGDLPENAEPVSWRNRAADIEPAEAPPALPSAVSPAGGESSIRTLAGSSDPSDDAASIEAQREAPTIDPALIARIGERPLQIEEPRARQATEIPSITRNAQAGEPPGGAVDSNPTGAPPRVAEVPMEVPPPPHADAEPGRETPAVTSDARIADADSPHRESAGTPSTGAAPSGSASALRPASEENRKSAEAFHAEAMDAKTPLDRRIELLRNAAGLDPSVAQYKKDLAVSYYSNQDYERCIEWAREAARVQPAESTHYTLIGAAYFAGGHYEDARKAHERALQLDPTNHFSRYNLALTLQALDLPGAIDAWEEYLRGAENDPRHQASRTRARDYLGGLKARAAR